MLAAHRAGRSGAVGAGIETVTVVPPSGSGGSSAIVAPLAAASPFAIARPRPEPGAAAVRPRANGRKICPRSASGIPGPRSETAIAIRPESRALPDDYQKHWFLFHALAQLNREKDADETKQRAEQLRDRDEWLGELEPWVVARTLIGLHQALVDYSRREIVAGTRNPTLSRRVRRQAQRALELLANGLADYGIRSVT